MEEKSSHLLKNFGFNKDFWVIPSDLGESVTQVLNRKWLYEIDD